MTIAKECIKDPYLHKVWALREEPKEEWSGKASWRRKTYTESLVQAGEVAAERVWCILLQ